MKVRAIVSVALLLSLAAATGGAALMLAHDRFGDTPTDLIAYLQRRLEGHPRLQALALPAIASAASWFKVGTAAGAAELRLPFAAPPLPPNPAQRSAQPADRNAAAPPRGVLRVGPGQAVTTLAEAARQAQDGDTVEIEAGDYVADVAVWNQARLTLRGLGDKVRLVAAGASAESKAIWVIRRGDITVENIEFRGARVPDRNGAGIRHESGNLLVRNCVFIDNENGILTGGDAASTLRIENSEFGYNGAGDGRSHNLYVGRIASLTVSGSWFHHANVGHLIKSRAARNDIRANRIADGSGGRASYELEFPNGGVASVVGNVVEQGSDTQNSTIVSYGVEGYAWPANSLSLSFNTFINDRTGGGTYVKVAAGPAKVLARNNLYVGPGTFLAAEGVGAADAAGELAADWSDFVRPARDDYRLSDKGRSRFAASALAPTPTALGPDAEFVAPRGQRTLQSAPRFPGALQTR